MATVRIAPVIVKLAVQLDGPCSTREIFTSRISPHPGSWRTSRTINVANSAAVLLSLTVIKLISPTFGMQAGMPEDGCSIDRCRHKTFEIARP